MKTPRNLTVLLSVLPLFFSLQFCAGQSNLVTVPLQVGVDFTYFDVMFGGQIITQAVTQVQMRCDTVTPLTITLARQPPNEYVYVSLFGGTPSCAYRVIDFDWIGFGDYKTKESNIGLIGLCSSGTLSDVFYRSPPGGWHPQTEIWYLQAKCPCSVGPLTLPHTNAPPYDESLLATNLQQALISFRSAVTSLGGTVNVTSGYRPPAYQAHLYEIRTKFVALKNVSGINASVTNGRPHLTVTLQADVCQNVVDAVNNEINQHQLVARRDGTPAVNQHSVHEQGLGVDLTVSGLPANVSLDELARSNGLYRPYPANDRVHFEPMAQPPRRDVTITGRSPINILVEDPLGRKVGFNSSSNAPVNEFGADASYSGAGSEPQVIHISPNSVVSGEYKTTGVGTGSGGYTIDVQVANEDDSGMGDGLSRILATGSSSAGQQLAAIPPIDCVRSSVLLQAERVGSNFRLFAPPWATNAVVQHRSNLVSGIWTDVPQAVNQASGLTITNLSSGMNFFRLKLP